MRVMTIQNVYRRIYRRIERRTIFLFQLRLHVVPEAFKSLLAISNVTLARVLRVMTTIKPQKPIGTLTLAEGVKSAVTFSNEPPWPP